MARRRPLANRAAPWLPEAYGLLLGLAYLANVAHAIGLPKLAKMIAGVAKAGSIDINITGAAPNPPMTNNHRCRKQGRQN